jgi:acetyltransferase-like isoleucine patch superfamily enzyme
MIPFNIFYFNRNSKISKTSKVYPLCRVTNSHISDYSYVGYSCIINNCEIGKFCSIANGVKIGLGKHPVNFISTSPLFYSPNNPLKIVLSKVLKFKEYERIVIGNDVWIGTNVTILDGVKIGNGAIIGANSVVTKNIDPYTIVGGVPAREIKKRFSEKLINNLQSLKWWDLPISFLKSENVNDIFSKELDEISIEKLLMLMKKE